MRWLVVILFLPALVAAQDTRFVSNPHDVVSSYFAAFHSPEGIVSSPASGKVQSFITRLETRRGNYRSDALFLEQVFSKTHRRFLKHFEQYARFSELMKNGTYNCLTGTALYALILEELGFRYRIIETNYHIFLLAETADGSVLFEATDPVNGFVTDAHKIAERVQSYRRGPVLQANSDKKVYYQFEASLYNPITLREVVGLLHYNLAVEAYNAHDLPLAVAQLEKAVGLYQSSRTEEFSRIVLLTVGESSLAQPTRDACIQKLVNMRKKIPVVASSGLFNNNLKP